MDIILGIDPGSSITGFGCVQRIKNKLLYLTSGCIKTPHANIGQKLQEIFLGVTKITKEFTPNIVAIEQVFMHQNVQSALKLGQARGVAIAAAAINNVNVHEYTAKQIKKAVTGYGAASKEQIQQMVKVLLNLSALPQVDAADALAVAICHAHKTYVKNA